MRRKGVFSLSQHRLREAYSEELLPRYRLEHYGSEALSHQELLAILLQTGHKSKHVMDLSLDVLNHFGHLFHLKEATIEELQTIEGIGPAKAIQLKATIELGKRLAQCNQLKLGKITSSVDIGAQLVHEMKDYYQEHLVVIYLNAKNEIIRKETIFIGSLSESVAHPREIFRLAVRFSASRLILVHNHPSGNPEPSVQDERLTKRLVSCGELLGIELLDHIVVGNNAYVSFQETGKL